MGGWGSASKMKEQGVEVARRNLRMHERNHSWGGLQSLGFDPLSEDVQESELSPSLASLGERTVSNLSPSSPPDNLSVSNLSPSSPPAQRPQVDVRSQVDLFTCSRRYRNHVFLRYANLNVDVRT